MFAVSDVIDGERIQITKRRYVVVSTTVNSNGVVAWWAGAGQLLPMNFVLENLFPKIRNLELKIPQFRGI